jgi:hypothetical protein
MTSVDSTSRFLAELRGKVAVYARASAGKSPRDKGLPAGEKSPLRDARGTIPQRVLAIDLKDPDRRRRAFRIFLESVIIDEFGEDLLNDPDFLRIIDSVHQSMQQDASLQSAIDKAGEFLLESVHRP